MSIVEQLKKRKKLSIALGIVGVLIIGGIVKATMPTPPEITSAKVENIDLVQSVSETGQVVSDIDLKYGWESSGRVVSIIKRPGDLVKKGDVIAILEQTKARTRLNEGFASLASAQARLNVEFAGPSDYDRKKSEASVDQARATLEQRKIELEKTKSQADKTISIAKRNIESAENDLQKTEGGEQSQIITDAYANLINTMKASVVTLRSALIDGDSVVGIDNGYVNDDFEVFLNYTYLNQANTAYYEAKNAIQDAENKVVALSAQSDYFVIDSTVSFVNKAASAIYSHLFYVQAVLNGTLPAGNFTQTELDALKATIATARTNATAAGTNTTKGSQAVSAARNSLSTYSIAYHRAQTDYEAAIKQAQADIAIAETMVQASEASLRSSEAQHDGFIAPPRYVDIAGLRADVARQAASVQGLRDDLAKTELIALADGIIGKLDIEVGETASQNQPVLTLISPTLSVKVDISESDISKLSLKDIAEITLDAFGDAVKLVGSVVSIEPGETEVSGVVYYKTTILINDYKGQDVRSGMTANVTVTTETKVGVLAIPQRGVLSEDGVSKVRVLIDKKRGTFDIREVKTGLRGNNGMIEIVSGLNEGDEIVTFIKEKK